jgi:hypothetical protein
LNEDIIIKLLPSVITALTTVFAAIFAVYLTNKYTKDREKEEKNRKRREANALVTDILSAWVHSTFDPNASDEDYNKYLYEMQTTYWKSILWVDKELLIKLNECISGKPMTNEMIAQTRKYVQGLEEPDVTAENIVNWSRLIRVTKK